MDRQIPPPDKVFDGVLNVKKTWRLLYLLNLSVNISVYAGLQP
jgi:hypothetical protein